MKTISTMILLFFLTLISKEVYSQTWTRMADMPVAKASFGCAEVNGKLYTFGGEGPSSTFNPNLLNIVEDYDPQLNSWKTKQKMPVPLTFIRAILVNGKIYAFGDRSTGAHAAFEYNPEADTWTEKSKTPESFSTFGASNCVVVNSEIYLQSDNKFFCYNPSSNSWRTITFDKQLPGLSSLAEANGIIYSMGGNISSGKDSKEIYKYDFETNTWSFVANLPSPREEHSSLIIGDRLYVVGGLNDANGSLLNDFYSLDLKSNVWTKLPSLPVKPHFPGLASVGSEIFIAGGTSGLNRFTGHQKLLYCFETEATTSVNEMKGSHLKIYPNPAKNLLNIEANDLELNYKLMNLSSATVLSGKIADKRSIDVSQISKGIYLLCLFNDKMTMSRKVIVD